MTISGNDTEVHIAPKSRQKSRLSSEEEQSLRSLDGKDGTGSGKTRSNKQEPRPAVFLRGVGRTIAGDWFEEKVQGDERDGGLSIWVDWSVISSQDLRGFTWVWVSIVRPPGLQASDDERHETLKPASKIVARLCAWENAPDPCTAAVSSRLCAALDAKDMAGEILRIEAAPPQASKSAVRSLKIYPFAEDVDRQKDGVRFGSKLRAGQQELAQNVISLNAEGKASGRFLDGPITDGMLCLESKAQDEDQIRWPGGIIKLHPPPGPPLDSGKSTRGWLLGADRRLVVPSSADSPKSSSVDRRLFVEICSETVRPSWPSSRWNVGEQLGSQRPTLVGIEATVGQLGSHLSHASSTLLTGGHGAGKTSLCHLLGHDFRRNMLGHVTYFPCQSLVTEETRISAIKDTMTRLFCLAAWRARLGGYSLVIMDDLDALCPAENELEVGNENNRNRHVSEIVRGIVREHCSFESRVCLLATAQSKHALHNIIVGGHVVREYEHIHAPDKDKRRRILEALHEQTTNAKGTSMNGTVNEEEPPAVDFLDVAGRTDGYMPGDLNLLVSRARSECLIRSMSSIDDSPDTQLTAQDFNAALDGFTPTSLRNVTLQHSSTSFSSIGGLKATRQILTETLQYPTLYAPIFEKCPLRLRSGLLLYGFPGCGKTLLASAVAGECGLNFISVKGPEILNKYIGASEKSVRDLFERAQAAKPCVLFFDEFDSVAPKRGHDSTGVTDRVVNQLLTQMDGAEGLSGVYVLAATSRPDLIDPALLRPGRLDKSLLCEMPNEEDREHILRALSTKLRMSTDASRRLRDVARRTDGYTGADLQAVIYNAHLEAIHEAIGDQQMHAKPRQGSSLTDGRQSSSSGRSSSVPDFTYFRIDEFNGTSASGAHGATERTQIAELLRMYKAAQHKARVARRESVSSSTGADDTDKAKDEGGQEPTIKWGHLEQALSQTRPSIAREEIRRLDKIYRDFVASRNGEMPSGQGGSEIGGRSSLM